MINKFRHWASINIGALDDHQRRIKRSLVLTSIGLLILEPASRLVIGDISVGAIGVSLSPSANIPLGLVLFCFHIYLLFSFWLHILTAPDSVKNYSQTRALLEYDPTHFAKNPNESDLDDYIEDLEHHYAKNRTVLRLAMDYVVPTILAATSLAWFSFLWVLG